MSTGESAPEKRASAFEKLKPTLTDLDGAASASLLAATADVAFLVTKDGVIRQAAVGEDEMLPDGGEDLVGRIWSDVVTVESRAKVDALLRELPRDGQIRWREINHALPGGGDVPIRFSALPLNKDGLILAVGRSLRAVSALQQRLIEAQRSMERDYARLRQAETRYRQLFQLASEGVLIIDSASRRITEANPAAVALTGQPANRIIGRTFGELFAAASVSDATDLLANARASGRAEQQVLSLAGGVTATASAAFFRQDGAGAVLVRMSAAGGQGASRASEAGPLATVVGALPDAIIVTDLARRITDANAAFLDMAEISAVEQVRGRLVDRWLGRSEADMGVLAANVREHGTVRDFATVLRGDFGATEEVEVSAVMVEGAKASIGFVVRAVGRRPDKNPFSGGALPRSADQLVELVGRMSLKEIVRETADVIEKLCVEAALRSTGDNRAAAAQILGLSRQSLYSKLRRYGLSDIEIDADDED